MEGAGAGERIPLEVFIVSLNRLLATTLVAVSHWLIISRRRFGHSNCGQKSCKKSEALKQAAKLKKVVRHVEGIVTVGSSLFIGCPGHDIAS